MDTLTPELAAGIAAARAGAKHHAWTTFLQVLRADPDNETAWLCLSRVMPTPAGALCCLEHLLALNPGHHEAQALRILQHLRLRIEAAAVARGDTPPAPALRRHYLLGEVLVEADVLTPGQLQQALRYQAALAVHGHPLRLGDILVRQGLVQPQQLKATLVMQVERLLPTRPAARSRRLGDYLMQQGLITLAQLQHGLAWQAELRQQGQVLLLGEVLVQLGHLWRDQLTEAVLVWHQEVSASLW